MRTDSGYARDLEVLDLDELDCVQGGYADCGGGYGGGYDGYGGGYDGYGGGYGYGSRPNMMFDGGYGGYGDPPDGYGSGNGHAASFSFDLGDLLNQLGESGAPADTPERQPQTTDRDAAPDDDEGTAPSPDRFDFAPEAKNASPDASAIKPDAPPPQNDPLIR